MTGSRPAVMVFDVNETLSDFSPLGARFVEVGASASTAQQWFASVLRDGFALALCGENAPFAGVARELLVTMLSTATLNRPVEQAVGYVMDGFSALELHPDVASTVSRLHEDGIRLVTLSNGATSVADRLLTTAGIRDDFERLLSVDDAPAWKPAASAYHYAAEQCETSPEEMLLVAVHPWDVHGARCAGLQSAWVNRSGAPYPAVFAPATHTVTSLEELVDLGDPASV